MKSAALSVLIASMAALSGGLAMSSLSDDLAEGFECEDLFDGDRIEIRMEDDGPDARRELRVRAEADTRFQVEVEFRMEGDPSTDGAVGSLHDGGDDDDSLDAVERRARVRICGFVEFADDGDGTLGADDAIVRSDLVRFGAIERLESDGAWLFTSESEDGRLRATARVPMAPDATVPLLGWTIQGQDACGEGATHYAVLVDQSDPADDERFLAADCGADLMATGEA